MRAQFYCVMTFGQTLKVLFLGTLHLRSLSLLSVETIAEVSLWGIIILLQRHNVLPTIRHLTTTAHKRSPGIRTAIICSAWWSVWQLMLHSSHTICCPALFIYIDFFACCSIKSLVSKKKNHLPYCQTCACCRNIKPVYSAGAQYVL